MVLDFGNALLAAAKSLLWIFVHESPDDVFGVWSETLGEVELDLLIDDHLKHHVCVTAKVLNFIRIITREHLEYQQAKTVEVHTLIVFFAQDDFRCDVLRSSTNRACLQLSLDTSKVHVLGVGFVHKVLGVVIVQVTSDWTQAASLRGVKLLVNYVVGKDTGSLRFV